MEAIPLASGISLIRQAVSCLHLLSCLFLDSLPPSTAFTTVGRSKTICTPLRHLSAIHKHFPHYWLLLHSTNRVCYLPSLILTPVQMQFSHDQTVCTIKWRSKRTPWHFCKTARAKLESYPTQVQTYTYLCVHRYVACLVRTKPVPPENLSLPKPGLPNYHER